MLAPNEVKKAAKLKEDENFRFRTFLKIHADEEDLDRRCKRLHEQLFKGYDCNQCRNCCKEYPGGIPTEDFEKVAKHLKITKEQLIEFFLEPGEPGEYRTKHIPCDFLKKDGSCMLGDCKPQSCKNYPHTNQPGRLHSLFGMLDIIEVCPVAFEIFERLKSEYGFPPRKGKIKAHRRGKRK